MRFNLVLGCSLKFHASRGVGRDARPTRDAFSPSTNYRTSASSILKYKLRHTLHQFHLSLSFRLPMDSRLRGNDNVSGKEREAKTTATFVIPANAGIHPLRRLIGFL